MISRYIVSFNMAALLTFGLFFGLQMLIASGDIQLAEKFARSKIVFVDIPKPAERVNDIEQPDPPVDVLPPETILIPITQTTGSPVVPSGDGLDVTVDRRAPTNSVMLFASEGDFVALIRPAPQYPARMAEQGIEGFVRIKYTVNEMGATENVVVVESSHRGFERNAKRAAEKFKFKPRIENGEPQTVHNVYSTLEFKLES